MEEFSISQVQESIIKFKITSKQLVTEFLDRINKIDKSGPNLNSVIEINPDALKIAETLDKERNNNQIRSPLHGIPILIKDNINTADKMMTTAGSLALKGHIAAEDAFIVRRLRAAGAIILGKTNLSEWANFRSIRSTSGWSSRGGQTKNPYCLNRSPCGSSSGSAVAVAANLCTVAIGTETDGSIICPSHVTSIVGIKPTIGLVSRSGIIPISHNQDTAGPMARNVIDAAILLTALIGNDAQDSKMGNLKSDLPNDYTEFLDIEGLRGARIGVARNYFGKNNLVNQLMEKAIEIMQSKGAIIIDPTDITTLNDMEESEIQVLHFDFKHDINEYLGKILSKRFPKNLKELIQFNNEHKNEVMPYFGQELLIEAEEKGSLASEEYKSALESCHRYSRKEGIDAVLNEYQLDAIIAPSGGPSWLIDYINGDRFTGGSSSIAAVAGYPNITVPAGYVFGLPIGISFFGGQFQEPKLLKVAYAFEQTTKVRKPPKFLQAIEFK
jgi:amidase